MHLYNFVLRNVLVYWELTSTVNGRRVVVDHELLLGVV